MCHKPLACKLPALHTVMSTLGLSSAAGTVIDDVICDTTEDLEG